METCLVRREQRATIFYIRCYCSKYTYFLLLHFRLFLGNSKLVVAFLFLWSGLPNLAAKPCARIRAFKLNGERLILQELVVPFFNDIVNASLLRFRSTHF